MPDPGAAASRREAPGLIALALALIFNAVLLLPEARIERVPLNDLVLHRAAAERLAGSLAGGEPLLDPWVSEWALGYPMWRSYQPLPHLLAGAWMAAAAPLASPPTSFAFLHYLLVALLPASFYLGARLLGLSPAGAGLFALLALTPSGTGDLDRYGLGYGAMVWRGSGLFTQVVALHLILPALGLCARAIDHGRRLPGAALALALVALSHIVYGYVAFVSAALLAWVGPRAERPGRLARLAWLGVLAAVLLAWFAVPLVLFRTEVNHSRWEEPYKWDSYGARFLLGELASGRLLDGGRPPYLTLLVLVGAGAASAFVREPKTARLLALAGAWLALYFGRRTWGHLLLLAAVPADLHLHRLQGAFELFALLAAAHGLDRAVSAAAAAGRWVRPAAVAVLVLALLPIARERARYLQQSAAWGEENLAAFARDRPDLEAALDAVRAILAARPGRVSAGKAATWGTKFRVGWVPAYAFLTRDHLDQVSFLYHSMSKTGDVMVLRSEEDAGHDVAFGVRAVLAPSDRPMPTHLRKRAEHGRFAVYESSAEGYFGLIDLGGRWLGSGSGFEPSSAWLQSSLLHRGVGIALDADAPAAPGIGSGEPLPGPPAWTAEPAGRVVSESREGETHRARLQLRRPSHAFFKATWTRDLQATVDGVRRPLVRITPGFGAVAVPAGEHDVEVRYAPRPWKPLLLGLGLIAYLGLALGPGARARTTAGAALAVRLARLAARATPRLAATLGLLALALLALRPLFRGLLIEGHDSLNYPPRLTQAMRVLADRHLPPVWAPDLGNGYGQPLFEFAPPLLYAAAAPLRAAGLGIADSLQLGVALVHLLGAAAVYRLGRRQEAGRAAALAATAAWLFAPYLALDLFVRMALAEAVAVAVAPLALLGLVRAIDRPQPVRVAVGAAAASLLPLAHNAAALLLLPALAVLVLARTLAAAREDGARAARTGAAAGAATLLLALGLSAWFWLPALLEKDLVKTDLLRQGFLDWRRHAVAPWQLLWSRWGHGYSVAGTGDGMSFALGPLHLLAGLGGLVVGRQAASRRHRAEAWAFAAAALAGSFLATTLSAPLWARVSALQYLAYPWRALLLPALFLPLLTPPLFARLPRVGTALAIAALVLLNLTHTEPAGYLALDEGLYAPASIASRGLNTTTREEYEPRWVEERPPWRAERLVGLDGELAVAGARVASSRWRLDFDARRDLRAEASLFYYRDWRAFVDGREVEARPLPGRGTIALSLPAGRHRLELRLDPTPLRARSLMLSLAVALGLLVALAVGRVKRLAAPGSRPRP